jgi:two-component system, LytTR family, response regulator
LDYLLKPVEADRFRIALERARERIGRETPELQVIDLLDRERSRYLTRLVAREVGKVTLIPVDSIQWIESADNYARVHTDTRAIYVRMTMKDLEAKLDPEHFMRVHRSAIVAVAAITTLEPLSHGEYNAVLASGVTIQTSRSYADNLRRLTKPK